VVPAGKQEAQIQVSEAQEGDITWLDVNAPASRQTIDNLKHDVETCIITTEKNKAELFAAGFSRVFTPSEIKGLQYKNVILYQLVDHHQKLFRDINSALLSDTQDDRFGPVLCELFTSITRAENKVMFYQSENESTKNILFPIKSTQNVETVIEKFVEINREESLINAKRLYQEGNHQQATATLRNEVFVGKPNRDSLISNQINEWAPKKETLMDAVNKKDIESIRQMIRKIDELTALIKNPRQIQGLLDIIYKSKDLDLLDVIVSHQDAAKIDWNYRCEKIGALHLVCQEETEQTIRLTKKLINEFKISINTQSNAKSELDLFHRVLTQKYNELAVIFIFSNRYTHENFLRHFPRLIDELRAEMFRLLKEKPIGIYNSFSSTFQENDREVFFNYIQKLFNEIEENEYTVDEKVYLFNAFITHFLKSYHYYKHQKIDAKMKLAEAYYKDAKKHFKDFSPSTAFTVSGVTEVSTKVTVTRQGKPITINDVLKDSILLDNLMNKNESNREFFFNSITSTTDPSYLILFLKNKHINFRKHFLNNKDDNFIVETLQNCYMKQIVPAQDEIIDFLEKYNANALHTLSLRLISIGRQIGRYNPIALMTRAALAPYPSIMANSRLAQFYETAVQEKSSIPVKIELLTQAIRFAERGDEISRMNLPKLRDDMDILKPQVSSASSSLVAPAWTGSNKESGENPPMRMAGLKGIQ
jgi:hypothetical protein